MNFSPLTVPAEASYPIEGKINLIPTSFEIDQMGNLAGKSIRNYKVTPQKIALYTSMALGVICLVLAAAVSLFGLIGVAVCIGVGLYCLFRKDMHDPKVREHERQRLAQMNPLSIIGSKSPSELEHMIEYDLGQDESREARVRRYVLLQHLKSAVNVIDADSRTHQDIVQSKFEELARPALELSCKLKAEEEVHIKTHEDQLTQHKEVLKIKQALLKEKQFALKAVATRIEEDERAKTTAAHNAPRAGTSRTPPILPASSTAPRIDLRQERESIIAIIKLTEGEILLLNSQIQAETALKATVQAKINLIQSKLDEHLIPLRQWHDRAKAMILSNTSQAQKRVTELYKQALAN